MSDEFADRKQLTFEQAEGAEPLPAQLQLRELSDELRSALWMVLYESFQTAIYTGSAVVVSPPRFVDPWAQILYDKHVHRGHKMADEFDRRYDALAPGLKAIFREGNYVEIFGFVQ